VSVISKSIRILLSGNGFMTLWSVTCARRRAIAFSSVDTGSRVENASNQNQRAHFSSEAEWL
jgi:hypothetical protein